MTNVRLTLLLLLAALLLPGAAAAQGGQPAQGDLPGQGQPHHGTAAGTSAINDPLKKVAFEQKLGGQLPLELQFVDETGKAVRLGDYFGEKPVIIQLAYFNCPMLCSLVRQGMTTGLKDVSLTAGKDFEVVNVSIDPTETPMNAANAKTTAVAEYGRAGSDSGWHFLTGTQDNIKQLADAIGFQYFYDETINQYAHAAGLVMATPTGELSRYFYGIEFNASDLRLGLVESSGNKIGSKVDQLLLLCYHYDPTTGTYSGTIMTVLRAVSVLFVLGMVAGVFLLSRGPRRPNTPSGPAQALG